MNSDDLTPLAKQEADPLVRALLRAGQRERAPEKSEERLLAVLGLGVTGGVGSFALLARVASRLGSKGLLSSPLLATAAVIAAAAVAAAMWSSTPSSREASPPSVTATAQVAASSAAIAPPRLPAPAKAVTPIIPSTRVEDLPSSQLAVKSAAKPAKVAPRGPEPGLAREVELVEAARAALARGDIAGALRSLDARDREIPAGALLPESRVLRIEALVRAGSARDVERANALGDSFLRANPDGPQARRVRSVLGRAD